LGQSGGGSGYDVRLNTQSGGGGEMGGAGAYSVAGTVGRPDPGAALTGNNGYTLRGGFWAGAHASGDVIFNSGFEVTP
jgi:hypothetical protein